MAAVDGDALKQGSITAFFDLFYNERGVRLRCNLPDTLVLRDGQPAAWFATNKEGYVVQRGAALCSFGDVRAHLVACALDGATGRCPPHVAIMRLADGTPKLLSRAALDALCDRLAAQLEAGERGDPQHTPVLLQAYVPPFLDLRYVANYTNDGADTSCHTFQRRFSRRYLPYREPAQQPQPSLLMASAAGAAAEGAPGAVAASSAAGSAAQSNEASVNGAAACGPAPGDAPGAQEEAEEVALCDGALADSERLLGRAMGPVDPSLKMAARKAAHSLVQYVQKAHLLTLRGLAAEFVRDSQGHLWLLGPLRCDWASLIPGRGGEPWANANLVRQPRDEDSWESTVAEEVEQGADAPAQAAAPAPVGKLGPQGLASGAVHQAAGDAFLSPPPADEGGAVGAAGIYNSLLPPPTMPTAVAADAEQPGSPAISAKHPAGAAQQPSQAQQGLAFVAPVKLALRGSPGRKGSPGASLSPAGNRQQQLCASSPSALWASGASASGGGCAGSPKRGPAVLSSHLTKELVSLQDELLVKTDLADALACKVEALEHDKHVITDAFERVLAGLQGDLVDVKGRLEALRKERDGLACQLAEASQKLAGAEAERDQLRGMLDDERSTAFASLGQFHKQQEDAGLRAAKAEAELRSLQERLREEQAACDALKKQMVFYQHASGMEDGGSSPLGAGVGEAGGRPLRGPERPEIKYADTLQAVEELLQREVDPTGERYSLAKVLHTCQSDLHAIFLHYCMLDANFARHWPPQLNLQGWLAFMKDIGSTNLVPGTRTRSDNTMHVQEATEVFRRYCLRQAVMRGALPPRSLSVFRDPAAAAAAAGLAIGGGASGTLDHPGRPPSSQSTAPSVATSSRPFSAAATAQLAGAAMSYQSFCAALVHVAAKLARGSQEAMEACPFLSEQTRAFVELIVPKAQRVAPILITTKKGGAAGGAGGPKSPSAGPAGGLGAKDAAAKEAAAKLPKLKKSKAPDGVQAGASGGSPGSNALSGGGSSAGRAKGEMIAIAEASREGSSLA